MSRATIARSRAPFLARYPGLSVRKLLDDAEISPDLLRNPNAWLSVRRVAELLESAAVAANDSAFAMAFAAQAPWCDLGMLAYLVFNSPTLGTAYANACRHSALQTTGASMDLAVEGSDAEVNYRMHDLAIARHPQNTVAFLLGYSDLSAFSRAFRRWTGVSALEFRRRAAAAKRDPDST
ncbi:MAG TPA: AraC family transcriptional regulator ligand-binding domain-containing protein [Kofleriaceae bacterium]